MSSTPRAACRAPTTTTGSRYPGDLAVAVAGGVQEQFAARARREGSEARDALVVQLAGDHQLELLHRFLPEADADPDWSLAEESRRLAWHLMAEGRKPASGRHREGDPRH